MCVAAASVLCRRWSPIVPCGPLQFARSSLLKPLRLSEVAECSRQDRHRWCCQVSFALWAQSLPKPSSPLVLPSGVGRWRGLRQCLGALLVTAQARAPVRTPHAQTRTRAPSSSDASASLLGRRAWSSSRQVIRPKAFVCNKIPLFYFVLDPEKRGVEVPDLTDPKPPRDPQRCGRV